MGKGQWRGLRLSLEWGATLAVIIALVAGAGTLLRGSIGALVVIGGAAATIAVFEHGWHRAPIPIGTPVKAIILLGLVWASMLWLGYYTWPPNKAVQVEGDLIPLPTSHPMLGTALEIGPNGTRLQWLTDQLMQQQIGFFYDAGIRIA